MLASIPATAPGLLPHSLDNETIAEIERQTIALARGLNVVGLMNVQFAIKDRDVYVLDQPRLRMAAVCCRATGVDRWRSPRG